MYSEHCGEFAGTRVVDFEDEGSWQGPALGYRLRSDYDDGSDFEGKLDLLLEQADSAALRVLVVGCWPEAYEGKDAGPVIAALVARAARMPKLEGLFLGDIVYEEQELSWINQSEVGPLLASFPMLRTFQIRGSNGLAITPLRHEKLETLIIESGGLPRSVLRQVFRCEFPNLSHLELHLGEENYGFDGNVEDLQPLLAGGLFPKLRYLGLRNCNIADDLAAVVVNAPILKRIATLDLSLGNLSEAGARALMSLPTETSLIELDVSHHYAPEEVIKELRRALRCRLIAEDAKEPDEEFRSIAHAE